MKIAFLTSTVCVCFCIGLTNPADAQQTLASNASTRATVAQPQPNKNINKIGFRLTSWKTIHSHNQQSTQETLEALKKIGCEVNESQHDGHVDIRYQCPDWKAITVETNQQLESWYDWLNKKGMETVIINPPAGANLSTVRYRLSTAQSAHFQDAATTQSMTRLYKMLECEVSSSGQAGPNEVTVRCQNWTTIGLPNCKKAHVWQDWLKKNGFETKHSH